MDATFPVHRLGRLRLLESLSFEKQRKDACLSGILNNGDTEIDAKEKDNKSSDRRGT